MRVNRRTKTYSKLIDGEQARNTELLDALDRLSLRQQKIFKAAEENGLWRLLVKLHNNWVSTNQVIGFTKGVSDELMVDVFFEKKVVFESKAAIIDRTTKLIDNGLTTKRRALMAVHPDLDAEQIDTLLEELKQEAIDNEPTSNESDNDIRQPDDKS